MSFNAYYNVETDTIHNCTPYSYTWFHERRHQLQFKNIKFLQRTNRWLEILTYGTTSGFFISGFIGFISFFDSVLLMGLTQIPYAFLNSILEIDALIFGTWDWYKHKKV